jgi:GntR family transcriptional repressor for pyruvate dehydrogenase complex
MLKNIPKTELAPIANQAADGVSRVSEILDIKPLERLVLIDQIIETIKRLIAEEKLKPGDTVPSERDLAELFKVSRTSVRQALKALAVMGVFEISHGARTYLNKSINKILINPMQFISLLHNVKPVELFETRKVLEVALAKLAAQHATAEDIQSMRESLDKAKKYLQEPDKFLYAELSFHEQIFKASQNRLLAAMMHSINNLLIDSRETSIKSFKDLSVSLKQHTDIFDALEKHDGEAAGEAMLRHLNDIEGRLVKINPKR